MAKIFKTKPRITVSTPSANPEERHQRIAEAAYYRALNRNFEGGDPVEDWLIAERQIDDSSS